MEWLRKRAPPPADPLTKLDGYHELCRAGGGDAMDRGAAKAAAGDVAGARGVYALAASVAAEGLALAVPTSGLGPAACTATSRRTDLLAWAAAAAAVAEGRGRALGAEAARAASGVGGAGGATARPAARPVRSPPNAAHSRPPNSGPLRPAWSPPSASRPPPASAAPKPARRSPPRRTPSAADAASGLRADVLADALDTRPPPAWDDVVGLDAAKAALREAVILPSLRSDLFQGLRKPARGVLLYGPPGNGKTLLVRALAGEAGAALLAVSAASLTSKWHGEAEKLMRALFEVAASAAPSILFIDEADSVLGARGGGGEHEASRRLKTEFLVQFDRLAAGDAAVTVVCATNRPAELDDAVRRRLTKRILVPLPDAAGRRALLARLLAQGGGRLGPDDLDALAAATDGYSHADVAALCAEAAMAPLRELGDALAIAPAASVRGVSAADVLAATAVVKPSADAKAAAELDAWTAQYGMRG